MEQKHVDEIWAIVATEDVITAGAPTVSAMETSGERSLGAEEMETSGERSGPCLPLWCRPDWGDFEDDASSKV